MDVVSIAVITLMVLLALWWVLRPLLGRQERFQLNAASTTQQTLEELVYRRDATYAAIKDLELDFAADKVSPADYQQLRARLTGQAAEILKQIDRYSEAVDDSLENEIDRLLSQFQTTETAKDNRLQKQVRREIKAENQYSQQPHCPNCQALVKPDDAFCSQCGAVLTNQCPQCGSLTMPSDMFCAHCGSRLLVEALE